MSYRTSRSFETKPTTRELLFRRLMAERVSTRDALIDIHEETNKALEEKVARLEMECFTLAAGVCEYRSGNENGNPICLATNKLIESMKL